MTRTHLLGLALIQLTISAPASATNVPEVLSRSELWTLQADGRTCGRLPRAARARFRAWKLDSDNTVEDEGVYGMYNPAAPRQLVVVFASQAICEEILGILRAEKDLPSQALRPPMSKKRAAEHLKRIYAEADDAVTLWCACRFSRDDLGISTHGCGVRVKEGTRVTWTPLVPVGKRNARAAADLHNLFPVIPVVATRLGDKTPAELPGEKRSLGTCDLRIRGRTVEPRPEIRGNIARTYIYVHQQYPALPALSRPLRKRLEAWHAADPVDAWECNRARRIAAVQGGENPVVEAACEAAGL